MYEMKLVRSYNKKYKVQAVKLAKAKGTKADGFLQGFVEFVEPFDLLVTLL